MIITRIFTGEKPVFLLVFVCKIARIFAAFFGRFYFLTKNDESGCVFVRKKNFFLKKFDVKNFFVYLRRF